MSEELLESCPACDYALDGLPDRHTCPECGFEYDKDSVILRKKITKFGRASRPFWPVFYIALVAYCVYIIFKDPLSWNSWWYPALLLVSILAGNRREQEKCVIAPDRLTRIDRWGSRKVVLWAEVDHAKYSRLWGRATIECHTGRGRLRIPYWMFRDNAHAHEFVAEVNQRVEQLGEEIRAAKWEPRTDN